MPRRKSLLNILLLAASLFATAAHSQTLRRVGIFLSDFEAEYARFNAEGWDVYTSDRAAGELELVVTVDQIGRLQQMGYFPTILEVGKPLAEALRDKYEMVPFGYKNLAEIEQAMLDCQNQFPGLCRRVNLNQELNVDATLGGRNIFALKISDNVAQDEDEPTALFVSAHHAREIVTPEAGLKIADYLLSNYNGSTRQFVDNAEIWIVPVTNPDGYDKVFTVDNLWRKNIRPTCASSSGDGVDLNRNYAKNFWDCGGSTNGCSQTYRGAAPFSEVESTVVAQLNLRENFAVSLDFHQFGQEVLWGYRDTNTEACAQVHPSLLPPIAETRNALASALGYSHRPPGAGGEHFEWQFSRIGTVAYLIELGTSFQPPFNQVPSIVDPLEEAVDIMLSRLEGHQVRGHVRDADTNAPLVARIEIVELTLIGGESGEFRQSEPVFGRYQWLLSPGSYTLRVSKTGYQTKTVPFTVLEGVPTEIDLDLARAEGLDLPWWWRWWERRIRHR